MNPTRANVTNHVGSLAIPVLVHAELKALRQKIGVDGFIISEANGWKMAHFHLRDYELVPLGDQVVSVLHQSKDVGARAKRIK